MEHGYAGIFWFTIEVSYVVCELIFKSLIKSVSDRCFTLLAQEGLDQLIPRMLNNPFEGGIPSIAQKAAKQLQVFLEEQQANWLHDFWRSKGKMFGVLVVKTDTGELGYLSTFSGKMRDEPHPEIFVPSLFDIATNDYFITKGMVKLSEMGQQIEDLSLQATPSANSQLSQLKEDRKAFSLRLQQQLFDQYVFLNHEGASKSLLDIFAEYEGKKPPSGAGECAAPKLLHYAFKHKMHPIAIAEFWWGKSSKSAAKQHLQYYPACEEKCRPILTYMLGL